MTIGGEILADEAAQARLDCAATPSPIDVDQAPPEIVGITPARGATDVDPATREIVVAFDRDMGGGFSWTGGGAHYPPIAEGQGAYWRDRRTAVLPVKLEPGRYYRIGINSKSHRNFKSAAGVPVRPSAIYFTTRGAGADVQAGLRKPAILQMQPANGARDVDPRTAELRVTFSVPMGGGFSWTRQGSGYPRTVEDRGPYWTEDRRTCVLSVQLDPNREYKLGLNSPSHINFSSAAGVPLDPVIYSFRTAADPAANAGGSAAGEAERRLPEYAIRGTVFDVTPDLSDSVLRRLEDATMRGSDVEFEKTFATMYGRSIPAAGVIVTARCGPVTREAVSDSAGGFSFAGLPRGNYELVAELPGDAAGVPGGRSPEKKQSVEIGGNLVRLWSDRLDWTVKISRDLVTIQGRIMDSDGRPICGATVRGEPAPWESGEVGRSYPTRAAESGADGSYELGGFRPMNIYKIAGFLAGGDPTECGQYPFYVDIRADAEGFAGGKARVPVVTEALVGPSRRLLDGLTKWAERKTGKPRPPKKVDVCLPASRGNTITGIDVVLTRKPGNPGGR